MPSPRDVIHSDPEIMGGTPVFTGPECRFKSLFGYLAAGDPLKDFLEAFPTVTLRQEKAALEMAKGALEAAADLQSGKLELKRWGTPAREVPVFEELLKHHLGVAMSVTAGCVIDPVHEAGWIAYNEVMEREIEQRFGKGAIDRVWNQSATVYRERNAKPSEPGEDSTVSRRGSHLHRAGKERSKGDVTPPGPGRLYTFL